MTPEDLQQIRQIMDAAKMEILQKQDKAVELLITEISLLRRLPLT